MAKFYNQLNDGLIRFIRKQKIFFTATSAPGCWTNLSPKGMDTFRCLDEKTVIYLNLTGSGNETAAHLNYNPRITIMFCSFDKAPLILRLYGNARSIHPYDKDWKNFVDYFDDIPGKRQIIVVQIQRVQTSCGYAVPFYSFQGERDQLIQWAKEKGEVGIQKYWLQYNQKSMDGLETRIINN